MKSFHQFAYRLPDGSTKFFIVETVTAEQDECVQAAAAASADGRCLLMATFKDCFDVTTYNDVFVRTEFTEFMADMVGFEELPESLQRRIAEAAEAGPESTVGEEEVNPQTVSPGLDVQKYQLVGELLKMGFSAKAVEKWLGTLGSHKGRPLAELVKDGVRALVSMSAN